MANALYVAAGGGGDAIGASIVHAALGSPGDLHIATFSWDRLLVDPVPGPRDPTWFMGLERVGRWNARVLPTTTIQPPAGSSLPRLAAELPAALYLLDPRQATVGLRRQLEELAHHLDVSEMVVVDVGGDILAQGDEPGLRSPLADSLVLAALVDQALQVRIIVAAPGADGELSPAELSARLDHLGARPCGAVNRDAVLATFPVFDWHFSEASGLLAAAAAGARGRVQLQAGGSVVSLTDETTLLYGLDLDTGVANSATAHAVRPASSLTEAEEALKTLGLPSEVEYERTKARLAQPPQDPQLPALLSAIDDLSTEATAKGIDFLTLRRVLEATHVAAATLAAAIEPLRRLRMRNMAPPLWVANVEAWPPTLRPQRPGEIRGAPLPIAPEAIIQKT